MNYEPVKYFRKWRKTACSSGTHISQSNIPDNGEKQEALVAAMLSNRTTTTRSLPELGVFRYRRTTSIHNKIEDRLKLSSEVNYYDQTLDHFNYRPESYATFKQKYVIINKYWGGGNVSAPIFVYLGAESSLSYYENGFMNDNAQQFKALQVYIEHRYYGDSIPFGSHEEAYRNSTTLGYFNSAQAIADYADILIHIKTKLQAQTSPIIAVGGSYGGMLAAWMRLKYPHVVLGALASSAPILYFDDITPNDGYYAVASRDFQEESQSCYETIKRSWDEMDRIASEPDGLSILSQKFKTCSLLRDAYELKYSLDYIYSSAAQYNPSDVTLLCQGIKNASEGSDILTRIIAGIAASSAGDSSCLRVSSRDDFEGWSWQTCSEMVMPIGRGNETMFFPLPFNLTEFSLQCEKRYGVQPRPHWVTSYYGGHDIKLILRRFGSNIIFSNGLKDPYSSGGVLENLSKTLVAITTKEGAHCWDIDDSFPTDPKWLVKQREEEVKVIKGWLNKYYYDLQSSLIK